MKRFALSLLLLTSGAFVTPATAEDLPALTSPNVEYLGTLTEDAATGAVSAKIVGKYLYVAGWRSFSIYEISDPAQPVHQSTTPLGFQLYHEDVDTNGKILVLAENLQGPAARLHIWDVTNKRAPREIATLLVDRGERTLTCLFKCRWAYGSAGTILDLREPSSPRVVGNWITASGSPRGGFDVTEAEPGMVVTSTRPMNVLDTSRPQQPQRLAAGADEVRSTHMTRWPGADDRFILASVEDIAVGTGTQQRCDVPEESRGTVMTFDATGVPETAPADPASVPRLPIIDEWRPSNGTFTDGSPPVNVLACSNHVFDTHPHFESGGLVASGAFDHGTRFLRVAPDGQITEIGWFLPVGGQQFAAYWANARIVYAVDILRGVDILRYTGEI